jgi:putative sulfotransferase
MNPGRFIVSTGRCGSTLLSDLLASHPSVLAVSELFSSLQPDAFPQQILDGAELWRLLSTPRELWTLALRQRIEPPELLYPVDDPHAAFGRAGGVAPIAAVCLPAISSDPDRLYRDLAEAVPRFEPGPIGVQYGRLFDWLARRLGKPVWIERSGGSLVYVADIARAFPRARVLHLYRNGPDVALSMSRHPFFRFQLGAEGPPTQEPASARRFGVRWSAMVVRGLDSLAALPPSDVIHLSYEELLANPAEALGRTAQFFGIEATREWIGQAASSIQPRRSRLSELDEAERAQLERVCAIGRRRIEAAVRPSAEPKRVAY